MTEYDINQPWLSLDEWQKEYIETEGNCFLLTGRQSGKSTAMSIKIIEKALKEPKPCDYLVIALTERQAYNLFFKALSYLMARYPQMCKKGKDKPTQHEINLKNGVCIMCYACGTTGWNLHGYTIKRLFVDEAAPMNREIFTSVTPMLSVSKGIMDISSTPRGKEGYFYDCSLRDDFKHFYVSAEDCPRHSKEFLESEKKSMSQLEYCQEYLALFLDDLKRFFPDELIAKCCNLKRTGARYPNMFMGMDIARMGDDDTTFEIIAKRDKDSYIQLDNIVTSKTRLTETILKTQQLDRVYNFKTIYIDDAGVGGGVFDVLLQEEQTKRKVVAINNAKRSLDRNDEHKKTLMKEDLYNNLLLMMEKGIIRLLDDEELILSLKSVQWEYIIKEGQPSRLRVFSNYGHIVEGLVRACWCNKDKHLNIWISSKSFGV